MRSRDEVRSRTLNPEAGTALAYARDYGLDLTLILSAVERTPEERLDKAVRAQAMTRTIHDTKNGLRRG